MLNVVPALVLAAALPPLADDVPEGSDLVVRVAWGELSGDALAGYEQLRSLAGKVPQIAELLAAADRFGAGPYAEAVRLSTVDLRQKGVTVTLVADFDTGGGPVLGIIVRGAHPKPPAGTEPAEERVVEGQRAFALDEGAVVFTIIGDALVMGNERGVQRLVRQLRQGAASHPRDPAGQKLRRLAQRLRKESPFMAAFVLEGGLRQRVESRLAGLRTLLASTSGGVLSAGGAGIDAWLSADSAKGREALATAVRGLMATLNAAGQGLLARGELAGVSPDLAAQVLPPPRGIETALMASPAVRWLREYRLTPEVHVRLQGVEAHIGVSSYRGLATAALVLETIWPVPVPVPVPASAEGRAASGGEVPARSAGSADLAIEAQELLLELRDSELAYKKQHGRYLACQPVPPQLPREAEPWEADDCFRELGFAPDVESMLQLEAQVSDGHLMLLARADPDGDGVPVVWYVDEEGETVRSIGAGDEEP